MKAAPRKLPMNKEKLVQACALSWLLLLGGLALAGPSGVLAWADQLSTIDEHKARIAVLEERRDELQNRVALLNPKNVDTDLATELFRQNLNVVHPDEYVIVLEDPR